MEKSILQCKILRRIRQCQIFQNLECYYSCHVKTILKNKFKLECIPVEKYFDRNFKGLRLSLNYYACVYNYCDENIMWHPLPNC